MKIKIICLGLLGAVMTSSSLGGYAAALQDEEDYIRLRLRNDLRRADKPSAGDGRDVYAWVQGVMLDANSHYYHDIIGIEGGAYYVYKLGTRASASSRFYLDGHDSFGYALGAIKVKLGEYGKLKIGRFGTDALYGSLPYSVPMIDGASNRTLPVVSEGAMGQFALTDRLDLWMLYRQRVFTAFDADKGIRYEGVFNPQTGEYDVHRPLGAVAAVYRDDNSQFGTGVSYQSDVALQASSTLKYTQTLQNDTALQYDAILYYASLDGMSRRAGKPNESIIASASAAWKVGRWGVSAAFEKVTHNLGYAVNTDIGYPFSLSMDRNHEGMWSYQVGLSYSPLPNISLMLAPIYTDGWESSEKRVRVQGIGLLGGVSGRIPSGPLAGLTAFIAADRTREKRPGSHLGDRLNYWDIKGGIQYDFVLK
ncbi:glucuronide uptake porin UidC [Edwardsiella piscicida]|uniref:glucuronide uptake porin UidC n=1 Tax=Edwardsiella piscicida TaxID=1263550 RepID=UPI00247A4AB3|nr:glucuronide uptake porin UidC [Edwardsiella piscicida]WGS76623.1 glucuronide uptake porin UidC [Edwardsiella piscicida]WGS80014.1 glucuronide uptake porin UidC [Edwardsiella piscicida]